MAKALKSLYKVFGGAEVYWLNHAFDSWLGSLAQLRTSFSPPQDLGFKTWVCSFP